MKINLMAVKPIENMYKKQNENSYRQNKVYEIKNKINSGTYSVYSKDIAKKILERIKESKK